MGFQWGLIGFSCCYLVCLEIRYLKIQWLIIIFRYNGNQLCFFFFRGIQVFSEDKAEGGIGFFYHTKNDDLTNKKGEISPTT